MELKIHICVKDNTHADVLQVTSAMVDSLCSKLIPNFHLMYVVQNEWGDSRIRSEWYRASDKCYTMRLDTDADNLQGSKEMAAPLTSTIP
jgi:hypothetical protein